MSFPNLSALDLDNIRITRRPDDGRYMFYYGSSKLYVRTSILNCPYGRDDAGVVYCEIPHSCLPILDALDELASSIIDPNGEDLVKTQNAGDEQGQNQYVRLVRTIDGKKVIKLHVNGDSVKVFDGNGNKVDNISSVMSNEFSSYFLLDLSCLTPFKDKYIWPSHPVQLRLKGFCTLPPGCQIHESLTSLHMALADHASKTVDVYDPVVDFDPDVNELL